MRRTTQSICFLGSVFGIFVMSVAIFLFYPGSYMALNKGSTALQLTASLLFCLGLLAGVILQIISLVLRKRRAPDFRRQMMTRLHELSKSKRIHRLLFQNRLAVLMVCVFLVGLVGTVCSLIQSTNSSSHTFFFIALTVFGLFEYMAFNSLNFAYSMREEWKL